MAVIGSDVTWRSVTNISRHGNHVFFLKWSVTDTAPVFVKLAPRWQFVVITFGTEFHGNPTSGLVADGMSQTDGHGPHIRLFFLLREERLVALFHKSGDQALQLEININSINCILKRIYLLAVWCLFYVSSSSNQGVRSLGFWWGTPGERYHLKNLGVDGG